MNNMDKAIEELNNKRTEEDFLNNLKKHNLETNIAAQQIMDLIKIHKDNNIDIDQPEDNNAHDLNNAMLGKQSNILKDEFTKIMQDSIDKKKVEDSVLNHIVYQAVDYNNIGENLFELIDNKYISPLRAAMSLMQTNCSSFSSGEQSNILKDDPDVIKGIMLPVIPIHMRSCEEAENELEQLIQLATSDNKIPYMSFPFIQTGQNIPFFIGKLPYSFGGISTGYTVDPISNPYYPPITSESELIIHIDSPYARRKHMTKQEILDLPDVVDGDTFERIINSEYVSDKDFEFDGSGNNITVKNIIIKFNDGDTRNITVE